MATNAPPKKRKQYGDHALARSVERVVTGGEKAALVSRETQIPYRTLAKYVRRVRSGQSISRQRTGPPPMLTSDGEAQLIEWMRALQRQGLPVRRRELMGKATELMRAVSGGEQLSAGWYKRFRRRHPEVTGSSTDLTVTAAVSTPELADAIEKAATQEDDGSTSPRDVSPGSSDASEPRGDMDDLSPSERAVLVLQAQYAPTMAAADVVDAFDVMLDPLKARVFLVMAAGEERDLWLRKQITKSRATNT